MTGDIEDDIIKNKHPSDVSIDFIDHHALSIFEKYRSLLKDEEIEEIRVKRIRKIMGGFIWCVILTLSKFPDSEDFVEKWRENLHGLMLDKVSI